MFVDKSAQEFYQLFSGIHEGKLFLQIVDKYGKLKYKFESPELDMTNNQNICSGIMEASYDFFAPKHFMFDEDFVLGAKEPLTIRRYGEKVIFEKEEIIKCTSFDELPAAHSWIFMESFLPFEKPLPRPVESNINELIRHSPKWITVNSFMSSGIAE